MSQLVARLKQADPTVNLKTHTYSVFGIHFTFDLGWVRVSESHAEKLRKMRQNDNAKEPHLFDVMTEKEAKNLANAEFVEKYRAKGAPPDRPLAVAGVSLEDDDPEEEEEEGEDAEPEEEEEELEAPAPRKAATAQKGKTPPAKPVALPGAPVTK